MGMRVLKLDVAGSDICYSEKENAGLNVTCASRVFFLESVVNHGFEVQGTSEQKPMVVILMIYMNSCCSYRPYGADTTYRRYAKLAM